MNIQRQDARLWGRAQGLSGKTGTRTKSGTGTDTDTGTETGKGIEKEILTETGGGLSQSDCSAYQQPLHQGTQDLAGLGRSKKSLSEDFKKKKRVKLVTLGKLALQPTLPSQIVT